MTGDENDDTSMAMAFSIGPMGRRRTRAQAKRDIHARREQLIHTRKAMEAMTKRQGVSVPSTPPRGKHKNKKGLLQTTPEKHALATPQGVDMDDTSTSRMASHLARARGMATRASRLQSLLPARGIAQSSSSGGRKRMISFSPERAERPMNEAAERQKRQRNLKATEKLELRMEGPMRTPEKLLALPPSLSRRSTPTLAKSPQVNHHQQPVLQRRTASPTTATPTLIKSPQVNHHQQVQKRCTASPTTASVSQQGQVAVAPSPPTLAAPSPEPTLAATVRSDTPASVDSYQTLELPSGDDASGDRPLSRASSINHATGVSCKKELDFTMGETTNVDVKEETADHQYQREELDQPLASQESPNGGISQPSQDDVAAVESASAEPPRGIVGVGVGVDVGVGDGVRVGVGVGAPTPFTSTSTIEDVGLFNCELDVEFSGGVYGEGTDGKVSAAMVRGQKVALKRAKPHDGFTDDDAKRRSAVELHYLRRVRHVPGFVQCLGLCDGIEHTCIALEVMDCKLSDYLRRYGQASKPSTSSSTSSKRRCFTLSQPATKAMLQQICAPMHVLHETVNVAHGDLACRNILLRLPPKGYEQSWEPVVKLSDFGRIKTPAAEPTIFDDGFSFAKNCDIGAFAREILYRLLVGEIVPTNCTETRTLHKHKHLQDVVVERIPDQAREKLGPYYRLFMRCAGWGVRPSFKEIVDHLDDLEYFEMSDNGYFPLKPSTTPLEMAAAFMSPMGNTNKVTVPSSGSKNKYETPTTANPRGLPTQQTAPVNTGTMNGVRLLQPSKSFTEGPTTAMLMPKTVNWLKARSVHPGTGGQASQQHSKLHVRQANAAAVLATPTQPIHSTPNGRPAKIPRKTPPSAGASRRSLQIINQFQHRLLHEKEKKKC